MTFSRPKKIKSILAVITALFLAGCSQNTPETQEITEQETILQTSALTSSNSEQTIVSEETTAKSDEKTELADGGSEYESNKASLIEFLDNIKKGDNKAVSEAMNANYDFFDDFTLDSYTFTLADKQMNDYDTSFEVTLNISSSSCDLFPDGESKWRITVGPGVDGVVHEFYSLDKADETKYESELLDTAYDYAYEFSHATGIFDGDKDYIQSYDDKSLSIEKLYLSIEHQYNDDGSMKKELISDILSEIKKRYNLTITEEAFREYYIDSMNIIDGDYFTYKDGHGESWTYQTVKSFEENDSSVKITLDYYGDGVYLFVVRTVEYTFDKNSDGSITLNSVKTIFDNGYELAVGAV
jgi:hypothetical protein